MHRRLGAVAVYVVVLGWLPRHVVAEQPALAQDATLGKKVRVIKSQKFVLTTDLNEERARETIGRMDAALRFAAHYWRRPLRGRLECYLAENLNCWSDADLPHPLARIWIGGIGGATVCEADPTSRAAHRAVVYASTTPGIVEHEVVHAYCYQTFGDAGPDWYKEGMAEAISLLLHVRRGNELPAQLIASLDNGRPPTVAHIVEQRAFTRSTYDSLNVMLAERKNTSRHVSLDMWTEENGQDLMQVRKTYTWSWALCHFLMANANYRVRFREMGCRYLAGDWDAFVRVFGESRPAMEFEFKWMIAERAAEHPHLWRWQWNRTARELKPGEKLGTSIEAADGFQATGLLVTRGENYRYDSQGAWSTSQRHDTTDADGLGDGIGRLVGVVFVDGRLSSAFDLGTSGEFQSPESGHLYVRCQDNWNELSDNVGSIRVRFVRKSNGK
jgi:hypothetical protein